MLHFNVYQSIIIIIVDSSHRYSLRIIREVPSQREREKILELGQFGLDSDILVRTN